MTRLLPILLLACSANAVEPACPLADGWYTWELWLVDTHADAYCETHGVVHGPVVGSGAVPDECTGDWMPSPDQCTYDLERVCPGITVTAHLEYTTDMQWLIGWSRFETDVPWCQWGLYDVILVTEGVQ